MSHPSSQPRSSHLSCRWGHTIGRTVGTTFSVGCLLAIAVLAAAPSQAASQAASGRSGKVRPLQSTSPASSLPICYIQMPSQSLQSLDKLCGVLPPAKTIALYTTDGQTPSPELLAAVRQADRRTRQAQSQADYLKIAQDLMAQLPLSDRARLLQDQMYSLYQRMEQNGYSEVGSGQAAQLQEQLSQDPSYKTADAALSQAREYLRRQQEQSL
jgi:hypothetical protein